MIKGSADRVHAITYLLQTALFLEPINIFLYTWRFILTLQLEEQNVMVKRIYRFVSVVSIAILPLSFYCVFAALVVIDPKTWYSQRATDIYYKLQSTIGYLALTSNLFSCIVMVLVLRLLK